MNPISAFVASPRGVALYQRLLHQIDPIIEDAIHIQQIPAPTFAEARRADYVRSQFDSLADSVTDVSVDALHNVYARLPGSNPALPALLISAHTDTVFGATADLHIQRDDVRIQGAGIGDNSLGVAALLGLMRLLHDEPLQADVWLVANSREEGLGDLDGMRAVVDKLGAHLGACVVLEGMAYGQIYHAGIAVRRLRIAAHAAGGHSWLHFGQPSAIHTLVRFAARLTELRPPAMPRTTYNIGLIEGGQSVNSIATDASLTLDMRSESPEVLTVLEKAVLACREPGDLLTVEVVGDRPAGMIPVTHPLVQNARQVLEALGTQATYRSGSTDANLPLSRGLPAITIGITHGGNAHRLDEFIETGTIQYGLWQALLIVLS